MIKAKLKVLALPPKGYHQDDPNDSTPQPLNEFQVSIPILFV